MGFSEEQSCQPEENPVHPKSFTWIYILFKIGHFVDISDFWGFLQQKNPISPFFEARGNKNIDATIRIGREIRCLPFAGFFFINCWTGEN